MGDKITLLPPADTSPHPEVLSGFDLLLDARRGVGKAKTAETDPMLAFAEASFLIEELNGYAGVRRDQTTEFKDGDKTVKSTVGERVARLPEQINRQFKRAEDMADGADFMKAAQVLNDVQQELLLRQQRLGQNSLALRLPTPGAAARLDLEGRMRADGKLDLEKFTPQELLILKNRLEQVITAPRAIREMHAAFLAETGDLTGAQKVLTESMLYGGGGPESANIRDDVALRLKRQAIAGGVDPLELARMGSRALSFHNSGEAAGYFDRATAAADGLNYAALRTRLKSVDDELSAGKATQEHQADLQLEKRATEELLHASAAVRFGRVKLAVSQGSFAEATNLVESAAKIDPEFVSENHGMYLNTLLYTRTEGKEQSVFEFHNHLVQFQRHLSPKSFDAEAAQRELALAQEEVKKLPADAIEKLRQSQDEKAKKLEADLAIATSDADKQKLARELEEAKEGLKGLELLAHAPAYTRLMEGVFALCNKKQGDALAIFDEIEKIDPEYAKSAATQLEELRKFATMPQAIEKEESFIKHLLKELGYTAAAIAAGALVVVATGWSGPAALAAGFAAGSATRTGLKYMCEGEVKWYDPLIGGVDGLSGGAGVLVRRAALSGLNGSARALTSAERAMSAVSADTALLEGLQGAQRFETARELAYTGLKGMRSGLPWYSRLPIVGNPAYREAVGAVASMGRVGARNVVLADLAAGATTSAIARGRQYAPKAFDGSYSSGFDLASDYGKDVFDDSLFSAAGGAVLRIMPGQSYVPWAKTTPFLNGQRRVLDEVPVTMQALEKIDELLDEINAPSTPKQVRQWYLQSPGPKVELYIPPLSGKK